MRSRMVERSRTAHLLAVAAALVGLLAAGDARADDATDEAQRRVQHATEMHAAGRLTEALAEMTVAYALDPQPALLYAIAQIHVQLGQCQSAITFYGRFLSTRPARVAAAAAREAIESCEREPVRAAVEPAPAPIEPVVQPPAVVVADRDPPRWYEQRLVLGLAGGGAVAGALALLVYRSARGDLDDAEAAPDHARHAALVDDAHGKRTIAGVLAVGGVGLIGGAVAIVLTRRRASDDGPRAATVRRLDLVPRGGGGAVVTWSGAW